MSKAELEACEAFELEWDPRLGGAQTRYLREVLAYCAKRLEMAGADREDLVLYLWACWAFSEAPIEGEGGES